MCYAQQYFFAKLRCASELLNTGIHVSVDGPRWCVRPRQRDWVTIAKLNALRYIDVRMRHGAGPLYFGLGSPDRCAPLLLSSPEVHWMLLPMRSSSSTVRGSSASPIVSCPPYSAMATMRSLAVPSNR